jgi:hypothetical protein
MPGAVGHRAASTAPKVPLPGPNPRSWPCGGVGHTGWSVWTGRWWWPAPAAAVALCRCPLLQSAAVASRLASAVFVARGQGRGRCLHRRGQPPRCARGPHARGSRRHSLTNHGSHAHRQPGRPVEATCRCAADQGSNAAPRCRAGIQIDATEWAGQLTSLAGTSRQVCPGRQPHSSPHTPLNAGARPLTSQSHAYRRSMPVHLQPAAAIRRSRPSAMARSGSTASVLSC